MLKRLLKFNIFSLLLISSVLALSVSNGYADDFTSPAIYSDKTSFIAQQVDLLKNRLAQAEIEWRTLRKQQSSPMLMPDRVNKQTLDEVELDIAVAKSNLDSVNIELTEAQQAINRLEKDIQEIQNQLNVFNMFGLKIAKNGSPNIEHLQQELRNQTALLKSEKNRVTYLLKLQAYADNVLQLYTAQYARIESLLKSQTMLQVKEQQVKTELDFEKQQNVWLQRLAELKLRLEQYKNNKKLDRTAYQILQHEIFCANENINLTYLQMLLGNYQDQIQQLQVSVARSGSITLFNKASDHAQLLTKQLTRLNSLLQDRMKLLNKRKSFLAESGQLLKNYQTDFDSLENQYNAAIHKVANLDESLSVFRTNLEKSLQQELSSRQGLPGFNITAWLDLGGEALLIPSLTFQVFKSLMYAVLDGFADLSIGSWFLLSILQIAWISLFLFFSHFLKRIIIRVPDHEFGHINLKWLVIKLFHRNLIDIAVIGNVCWFFYFLNVPEQNFTMLFNFAIVWLIFKTIIMLARLCLVETVHDRAGNDVRLYHQLKLIFLIGGVVTMLTVFMHQLPIIYEVKDLFDRLFLLFLLIVSVFLLRQGKLVPGLFLPYIDEQRTYLRGVIILLGLLIPLILLVNSLIGLFGFVNLILTISWYESVFVFVLVGYLLFRGLLTDGMELLSKVLIRHVTNGWLWTEAFLKPIDRVLHIMLFFSAWAILFLLYGWDQQSPVVERLNKMLHYHLAEILNTAITPLSIIELAVIISLLYWAARWTREFMYRMLLSRTKDLGLRNSLAILSQYAMIVVGVFISLRLLGIDFRALTVVATAFAFGVGLGLRDLVNNFVCGFLLLFERPLRVGDTVSVNDYEGEVIHIGGRAVTIRTWDHMDVLVPNAEIFSKSFTNWTAKDSIVRTVATIRINRHDNPHEVQEIIYQVLEQHKDVLKEPPPEVFLKELTEGVLEFEVRYYLNLRQVKSRVGLRSEVLLAIWDEFEKHGIQPPYPQHEVYVKNL